MVAALPGAAKITLPPASKPSMPRLRFPPIERRRRDQGPHRGLPDPAAGVVPLQRTSDYRRQPDFYQAVAELVDKGRVELIIMNRHYFRVVAGKAGA